MSDKIKVALFVPSLCYGGAERQVVEIARHLDPERFDAQIVTLIDYSPLISPEDELHQRLHIVERPGGFDPGLLFRVRRIFRALDVQIVHSFLFLPEFLTRLAAPLSGGPVVIGSERNTDYQLAYYRWACLKLTSGLSDLVIANSRSGASFNANYFDRSEDQYRVLYNGVDTDRFMPGDKLECRREVGIVDEDSGEVDTRIVIGMFGSFKRQKNHTYLFEALASLENRHDILLLLVGDTLVDDHEDTLTYKSEVQASLKSLALTDMIKVLGNRADVEKIYPACDFTVLPSHREGTPNVVLESMACGVPAIVTDVSDNALLVSDQHDGLVIPLDEVDIFAGAIQQMVEDLALRDQMGKAARQKMVADFSLPAMARNLAAIYEEALTL